MATDETLRRQGIVCTQEGKERAEDEQHAGRKEDVPQSYQGRHDAAYGKTDSAEKCRSHACIFSFAFHGQRVGSGKGDACQTNVSYIQKLHPCDRAASHAKDSHNMPLLPMYNASFIVGNLTATVEAMAMAMAFAPKHRLNCMAERP